jgi:hypothetical protein
LNGEPDCGCHDEPGDTEKNLALAHDDLLSLLMRYFNYVVELHRITSTRQGSIMQSRRLPIWVTRPTFIGQQSRCTVA